MGSMHTSLAGGFAALAVLLPAAAPSQATEAGGAAPRPGAFAVWKALTEAPPAEGSVAVDSLTIERDAFTFEFGPGTFHWLSAAGGPAVGAVFVGEGRWRLAPATEGERRHLARRAGVPDLSVLEEGFDGAVLWFADGTAEEIAAAGGAGERPVPAAATGLVERWRSEPEVGGVGGVQLGLVRALANDEGLEGGAFWAWLDGGGRGPVLAAVDPAGALDDEETVLIVGDGLLGSHWYASHRVEEVASGRAAACRLRRPADALHYGIDAELDGGEGLTTSTTVRFVARAPAVAVVPFALAGGLEVRSVVRVDGEGEREVPWLRWKVEGPSRGGSWLAPVLGEALADGEEATLRFTVSGEGVLEEQGVGIWSVRQRASWYPKLGGFHDRATYDLRFVAPPGNRVVAVGDRVAEGGAAAEGVSRWRSDEPITVAGFNYGAFELFERQEEETDTRVEVWAATGTPDVIEEINRMLEAESSLSHAEALAVAENDGLVYVGQTGPTNISLNPSALGERATADGINSVRVLSHHFGPLPHRRLALSQQSEWSFGQAWPTLIYLPYLSALGSMMSWELGIPGYAGFADEVTYHEIAHQWWGHRVGWESYRDQWLSEGFAEFSTGLLVEAVDGWEAYDEFWEERRLAIVEGAGRGAAPAELGSIDLGFRAATPEAPGAYAALTYSKGAYVLHMMRMAMRQGVGPGADERFFAMLRDFADTFDGTAASTADFQSVAERHIVPELDFAGDGSLDWYFDQWVEGEEIPRYAVDVEVEKAGRGRYRLHGTIAQRDVPPQFVALVPLYAELGKGKLALLARVPFQGEMERPLDVTLEMPRKPKRVVVNALHDVLARE